MMRACAASLAVVRSGRSFALDTVAVDVDDAG